MPAPQKVTQRSQFGDNRPDEASREVTDSERAKAGDKGLPGGLWDSSAALLTPLWGALPRQEDPCQVVLPTKLVSSSNNLITRTSVQAPGTALGPGGGSETRVPNTQAPVEPSASLDPARPAALGLGLSTAFVPVPPLLPCTQPCCAGTGRRDLPATAHHRPHCRCNGRAVTLRFPEGKEEIMSHFPHALG